MKKILIVVPVYISHELHMEFTKNTIESIHKADHTNHTYKIYIISSYCKNEFKPELEKLTPDVIKYNDVNGVSIAWNTGIKHGIDQKYDGVIVINNDIIFHQKAFDNLITFSDEHPNFIMWTMAEWKGASNIETRIAIHNNLGDIPCGEGFDEHPHFSAFMITPDSSRKLAYKELQTKEPMPGLFDEKFAPAYFEDGDMHQRILRYGFKAGHTATALFYHYGSRTIKIDQDLNMQNGLTYEKNRRYFKEKWNFDPHGVVIEHDDPIRFENKGPFEANKSEDVINFKK